MSSRVIATKFPRLQDPKELGEQTLDQLLAEYGGKVVTEVVSFKDDITKENTFYVFESDLNALCFCMRWS